LFHKYSICTDIGLSIAIIFIFFLNGIDISADIMRGTFILYLF